MDIPFFIWLLGMTENMAEMNRPSDVDMLLALVCAYHLQHEEDSQNPVTEALKMAHGHALLESALIFLSKHGNYLHTSFHPNVIVVWHHDIVTLRTGFITRIYRVGILPLTVRIFYVV